MAKTRPHYVAAQLRAAKRVSAALKKKVGDLPGVKMYLEALRKRKNYFDEEYEIIYIAGFAANHGFTGSEEHLRLLDRVFRKHAYDIKGEPFNSAVVFERTKSHPGRKQMRLAFEAEIMRHQKILSGEAVNLSSRAKELLQKFAPDKRKESVFVGAKGIRTMLVGDYFNEANKQKIPVRGQPVARIMARLHVDPLVALERTFVVALATEISKQGKVIGAKERKTLMEQALAEVEREYSEHTNYGYFFI